MAIVQQHLSFRIVCLTANKQLQHSSSAKHINSIPSVEPGLSLQICLILIVIHYGQPLFWLKNYAAWIWMNMHFQFDFNKQFLCQISPFHTAFSRWYGWSVCLSVLCIVYSDRQLLCFWVSSRCSLRAQSISACMEEQVQQNKPQQTPLLL